MMSPHHNGIEIRVKGKVQGVGFRPYVWQIAHRLGAKGSVLNDGAGVLVRLWPVSAEADFIAALYAECPPLAQIDQVTCQPYCWETPPDDFIIEHSGAGQMDTHIVPDAATCDACRQELFDPCDRRYRYSFINCTHCGPRFTIIRQMPYDRPNTAMAAFPFCPTCQQEYRHPADRRFHAQPNACHTCGPQVWLSNASGTVARDDDAIIQAAAALCDGRIVAVKGLGGFHLACDATDAQAVARLRARKHRPAKPLAVMLPEADWLARCSTVTEPASALRMMQSPAAPIVLLPLRHDGALAAEIAPGLDDVGLMLPANPLQHLLLAAVARPLVMTSGNAGGKPPALDNMQALAELAAIADLWLLHDRDIVQRADDSVVRMQGEQAEMLRRARGYVPDALPLPPGFSQQPSLLAMGADLKNTFCLLRDGAAIVSQHLGDLADDEVEQQYRQAQALFADIYRFTPQAIAVDAHPGYVSRRLGQQQAEQLGIPCIEVLHHHAHIVACLAEHQWPRDAGPVIGLALDGIGYGGDNRWWGGECLRVDYGQCQHLGGLPAVALPGGDLAARQPWRNLLAQCLAFVPDWETLAPNWETLAPAGVIPTDAVPLLTRAIGRGLNAPLASSAGRLFDAVAAACGFAGEQSWEGEAACWLEALARQHQDDRPPVTLPLAGTQLDLATFWRQFLAYRAAPADRAFAFHLALADGLAALVRQAAREHGLNTVACSGGVMHNRLLVTLLRERLADFTLLSPSRLPAGDGGLALGQALIAASCLSTRG
ncbi:carbamoyltransferase HypF [Dickeya dianthicola]|uniref:carbamoyltransferase HypF n=5 Tax=Dickeya dianthicola TaxID=204039 RepID=UPI0009E2BE1E|nr:carbamoyltransferase HypF [Dickeya dianthicola]MBI0500798.1 carbamoyltransferase HypF [Dickeya dianthicola]MCI4032132.1 carbamoyltransferase HypF [Dickeya dianthicola]MCI4068000.1 carbamoyltransferase HypF [Dickeya dianthicola]MCI4171367.1 carbamoyltransferase HypF [Dickeya dianthicola]MCI4177116.1 carbamoyltransferase HypF [Dickeya dianthicola]